MARSMHLVSRLNTNPPAPQKGAKVGQALSPVNPKIAAGLATKLCAFAFLVGSAWAQLPDGPGKAETERLCSQCHELARSISLRQDRAGWEATVDKMVSLGAKATDQETATVIDYLAAHFAAEEVPRINVNKARAIDLESGLTLRRSEAAAIIEYRTKNGPFKSIDDLKKVPGIDAAKIEAKKDRLIFEDKP